MFHISDLKAPGPDGLHAVFYKRLWHIIGEDLTDEVLLAVNCHTYGRVEQYYYCIDTKGGEPGDYYSVQAQLRSTKLGSFRENVVDVRAT